VFQIPVNEAPQFSLQRDLLGSCTAITAQASLRQSQIQEPLSEPTKMKIIDEMLNLDLLTHEQHLQISAWIARSSSPEEILQMPPQLWQAVERASQTMGIDEDLLRPPSLDAGDVVLN
jgi:hypothetical protein